MIAPPLPCDEEERLNALYASGLLDSAPHNRLNKIVEFARGEFNVPIALISLVDKDRQWFKAKVGLDVCETSRRVSFCGHAILRPTLFIVENALLDPRFSDNPLVTGPPHIRFYAGAPLFDRSGHILGTLCLIDTKARSFGLADRVTLQTLRDLALRQMLASR